MFSTGCTARGQADPISGSARQAIARHEGASRDPGAPHSPERCLGLADHGIFGDLDPAVQLALPAKLTPDRITALLDTKHGVLVVSVDGFPRKAYPLGGPLEGPNMERPSERRGAGPHMERPSERRGAGPNMERPSERRGAGPNMERPSERWGAGPDGVAIEVGRFHFALRAGDREELRPYLTEARIIEGVAEHDRDGDGIPDPLDVLIGAKKTVINADSYTEAAEGYIGMTYPGGDVPRTIGVCTDVIVRAVRNAGHDLQKQLHEDVRVAKAAYPMVKGAGDPSIDQRRVGTLLPFFIRHWERHTPRLDDPDDPLRPGDVIFMDTFPRKSGPDHIGILSDRADDNGLPLVINNWTDGTVTAEMDLLTFVPVMYRFRLPP